MTKYRDFDGVTRPVERSGKTKAAAERELKQALTSRTTSQGGSISPNTKFRDVAEQWFVSILAAVDHGTRSPTTADVYRSHLDRHVLPALAELRVREVTVPRVDAFLVTLRQNTGTATAKTARTIVSNVLGLAVRHGALGANPTRETTRIEGGRRKTPRALTLEERQLWLAQLEADEVASRKDLPDLSRFMLATGVRIGEALAACWPDLDLTAGTVAVNFTVARRKGKGLIRKSTKTSAGERTLPLPSWAVDMLRRRYYLAEDKDGPIFPDSIGGLRDPSNTLRDLRNARGSEGFAWVTSHVFRKTAATILDEAGLTPRLVADQLGHSRPSLTQDVYMARKTVSRDAATALEAAFAKESN
ncbi:integrase [Saccharopolyspora gloriosae]|uniref:Integrase n=1 Tax=Saccharopolyspora gloriosae TaxID=455344 RepID=A0A840NR14_9PSEU|nr:integrase [Saccharopolyspora gloriosae]